MVYALKGQGCMNVLPPQLLRKLHTLLPVPSRGRRVTENRSRPDTSANARNHKDQWFSNYLPGTAPPPGAKTGQWGRVGGGNRDQVERGRGAVWGGWGSWPSLLQPENSFFFF